MLDVHAAYIAGFLDGEGHIKRKGGYTEVRLYNTNRRILREIRALVGFGKIYLSRKGSKNHKPCYRLVFSSDHARSLLRELRRYSRLKF